MYRKLSQVYPSRPSRDGDGVKINRIAGASMHRILDPFLMVDEINSDTATDYMGGFPEHPHRGFETITYMKAGRMRHRDHMGNEGVIGPGDVQWMTAGAGVVHSELPHPDFQRTGGVMHGFQLWVNLPAADKMIAPRYRGGGRQDIQPPGQDQAGSRPGYVGHREKTRFHMQLRGRIRR